MKKRKLQKILFLVLGIVLIFTLTACAKENDTTDPDNVPDTTPDTTPDGNDNGNDPGHIDFDVNFIEEEALALMFVRPEHWAAFQSNQYDTLHEELSAGFNISFWDPTFDKEPTLSITMTHQNEEITTAELKEALTNVVRSYIDAGIVYTDFIADGVEAVIALGDVTAEDSVYKGMAAYIMNFIYDGVFYAVHIYVDPEVEIQTYMSGIIIQSFMINENYEPPHEGGHRQIARYVTQSIVVN